MTAGRWCIPGVPLWQIRAFVTHTRDVFPPLAWCSNFHVIFTSSFHLRRLRFANANHASLATFDRALSHEDRRVCVSVTNRYHVEINELGIMRFVQSVLLLEQILPDNSKGNIGYIALISAFWENK